MKILLLGLLGCSLCTLAQTGGVGIGTTPASRLEVNGGLTLTSLLG
jgi:hypothetical protein